MASLVHGRVRWRYERLKVTFGREQQIYTQLTIKPLYSLKQRRGTPCKEIFSFIPLACLCLSSTAEKTLKLHQKNPLSSAKAAPHFTEQQQPDVLQPGDAAAAVRGFCGRETRKRYLRKVEQCDRKVPRSS